MSETVYFKAYMREDNTGKKFVIFGTAFLDMRQRPDTQAKHIALVQGHGTSTVMSLKEYDTGEEWYEAQYGKGSLEPHQKVLSTVKTGRF